MIFHLQSIITSTNSKISNIDFILGFASEVYVHGKGTGNFHPTWNLEEFDIEWVKKVKETIPHARVIISIGGVGSEFPFDPIEKHVWIYRAIESIKWIVRDLYDNLIDGIDIHYDVIKSSEDEFSFSIGKVIRKLKNDIDLSINVISIAPNELFQSYYLNLYLQNEAIIDLVDFQFYDLKPRTLKQLVELYEKLVYEYTPTIVLPIISSHPVPIIIEFIKYLLKNKLLPGIVVWDDNNSTDGSTNTFSLENVLQHL
ncbi:chitinase 1-like [Cicer arietinum]|uniref:RuBisCO-associated protein-like n=1 Tax=Cicer arietinum TaxID=3827 RepID=A0A1S2XI77_CICAR|nr:ruBisCO-associated protein-like [Cicer arietinum]